MTIDRRGFLRLGALAIASESLSRAAPIAASAVRPKAVLFDAFALFDAHPVGAAVARLVRDAPDMLYDLWRTRIFEYQWLHALSGRYVDFETCVAEALDFAADTRNVRLTSEDKHALVAAWSSLDAWSDVDAGLAALAAAGVRTGLLSNMSERMLRANLARNGWTDRVDFVLSTDRVRAFKPDPRAYELACDASGLAKRDIVFVAFAGWDAAGATWSGLPTYWLNRARARPELGAHADGEGTGFDELVAFVRARSHADA